MFPLVRLLLCFTLLISCFTPNVLANEISHPTVLPQKRLFESGIPSNSISLKGMTINPEHPLQFDFLFEPGNENFAEGQRVDLYQRLIKYFLTSLTISDDDQWVNLSPYEKDRIIEEDFGKTLMGRDLLSQDYTLKMLVSSMMNPQTAFGERFWKEVYAQIKEKFGQVNVNVNAFNKIWITPDEAYIYEKDNTAYILKSRLKVLLEEDYLAQSKREAGPVAGLMPSSSRHPSPRGGDNQSGWTPDAAGKGINPAPSANRDIHNDRQLTIPANLASSILRETIVPQIEKEVNEGKDFALLRQIYSGMILATWYKGTLRESLLTKVYADQKKIGGLLTEEETVQQVYQGYLKAFKKGAFEFIKEEEDSLTKQKRARKYFAGGFDLRKFRVTKINSPQAVLSVGLQTSLAPKRIDRAQVSLEEVRLSIDQAILSRRSLLSLGGASAVAGLTGVPTQTTKSVLPPIDIVGSAHGDQWVRWSTVAKLTNELIRPYNQTKVKPSSEAVKEIQDQILAYFTSSLMVNVISSQRKAVDAIRNYVKQGASIIALEYAPDEIEKQKGYIKMFEGDILRAWKFFGINFQDRDLDNIMLHLYDPVFYLWARGELKSVREIVGVEDKEIKERLFKILDDLRIRIFNFGLQLRFRDDKELVGGFLDAIFSRKVISEETIQGLVERNGGANRDRFRRQLLDLIEKMHEANAVAIVERNQAIGKNILNLKSKGRVLLHMGTAHVAGLKEIFVDEGYDVRTEEYFPDQSLLVIENLIESAQASANVADQAMMTRRGLFALGGAAATAAGLIGTATEINKSVLPPIDIIGSPHGLGWERWEIVVKITNSLIAYATSNNSLPPREDVKILEEAIRKYFNLPHIRKTITEERKASDAIKRTVSRRKIASIALEYSQKELEIQKKQIKDFIEKIIPYWKHFGISFTEQELDDMKLH